MCACFWNKQHSVYLFAQIQLFISSASVLIMSRKEWTFLQYFTWKSMTSQKLCTFSFLARFLLIFKNSVQIWIIFHIFLLSCYMFFLFLTFLTQHAILGVTSPENNISLSTLATKAKNINFFLSKCVILIILFLRGCNGKLNNV